MRITIADQATDKPLLSIHIPKWWLYLLSAIIVASLLLVALQSYYFYQRGQALQHSHAQLKQVQQELLYEQRELRSFYQYADGFFEQQAKQAGLLQARITRLEALGNRLAERADFADEFDFYQAPSIGGPADAIKPADALSQVDIRNTINQLSLQLDRREQEIQAIDALLNHKKMRQESHVAGRPAASGWLSSPFGKRIDPFTGRASWHNGVDFAGKEGTHVQAVAAGVVVWSGSRYGYGNLVEVNHGNGLVTRYAHNKKNVVNVGDVVSKGQTLAKMGSTGRSTGPHVHFEVLRYGQAVDPRNYIYRKSL